MLRPSAGSSAPLQAVAAVVGAGSLRSGAAVAAAKAPVKESPLQRYHRLTAELAALEADVAAVSDSHPEGGAAKGVWPALSAGAAALKARLAVTGASLGVREGAGASGAMADDAAAGSPSAGEVDRLQDELAVLEARIQALPSCDSLRAAPATAAASAATAPAVALALQNERRVAALEARVGDGAAAAQGSVYGVDGGLGGVGATLASRVAALETAATALVSVGEGGASALESSAAAATAALQALRAAASASGPAAQSAASVPAARVAAAVATLSRLAGAAPLASAVASRLQALDAIHAAAATGTARITVLEQALAALDAQAASETAALAAVHAGLQEAAATLRSNLAALASGGSGSS